MNKKGISNLILPIILLGFIAAASIFGFLFVKNVFTEELIPPVVEESVNLLENDYGNNTELITLINSQTDNFQEIDFGLDLIFLAGWIGTIIITGFAAYKMPKMSKIQFLSFLFIGMILLLLGLNYIEQIFTWFVTEFINNTFSPSETYLPMFNFYVDNFIIINIFHIILLLLINQFSRKDEEELTYEGEDTQFQEMEEETNFVSKPLQE